MVKINQPPEKIIIVGGGSAGWMTASLMQQAWGNLGTQIMVIESRRLGTVGVGEGSTPTLRELFRKLDIADSEWMPACNATYKCGISFPGWQKDPGKTYFHPFYSQLDTANALRFFDNCNHRRKGHDVPSHPDLYFVTSELARQRKAPVPEHPLPFNLDYGYHFDAELLGQFLGRKARAAGVEHLDAVIDRVEQDGQGNITAVYTEQGERHCADLFVDCSGLRALLSRQTQQQAFVSCSYKLLNDSAVALPTALPDGQSLPSETVSQALSHGWAWHIPLTNRMGNGYVYSSEHLSPDQAEAQLRHHLGPASEAVPARHLHWQPGRLQHNWTGNCFAVGLSQGFLEPLEAAMLHTIQYTAESFIHNFERGGFSDAYRDEHNRKVNLLIDGTRDYLQLHYLLNGREDSDYWHEARNNPNRSSHLRELLQAWDRGECFEDALAVDSRRQVYKRTSWYCLLAGMERFQPAHISSRGCKIRYREKLAEFCRERASIFPDHLGFLARQTAG